MRDLVVLRLMESIERDIQFRTDARSVIRKLGLLGVAQRADVERVIRLLDESRALHDEAVRDRADLMARVCPAENERAEQIERHIARDIRLVLDVNAYSPKSVAWAVVADMLGAIKRRLKTGPINGGDEAVAALTAALDQIDGKGAQSK
jgi:hypothetical protein